MANKLHRLLNLDSAPLPVSIWQRMRSLSSAAKQYPVQSKEASKSAPAPPEQEEKEKVDSDGEETGGVDVNKKTREIGGPKGPEPTRYGDWERGGRCSDF